VLSEETVQLHVQCESLRCPMGRTPSLSPSPQSPLGPTKGKKALSR
jgi:hypothetical protein